jgi:hypothetical protein
MPQERFKSYAASPPDLSLVARLLIFPIRDHPALIRGRTSSFSITRSTDLSS